MRFRSFTNRSLVMCGWDDREVEKVWASVHVICPFLSRALIVCSYRLNIKFPAKSCISMPNVTRGHIGFHDAPRLEARMIGSAGWQTSESNELRWSLVEFGGFRGTCKVRAYYWKPRLIYGFESLFILTSASPFGPHIIFLQPLARPFFLHANYPTLPLDELWSYYHSHWPWQAQRKITLQHRS